jgi:hypothetical protein
MTVARLLKDESHNLNYVFSGHVLNVSLPTHHPYGMGLRPIPRIFNGLTYEFFGDSDILKSLGKSLSLRGDSLV